MQKALEVKRRAIALLDERRREFYLSLLSNSGDALNVLEGRNITELALKTMPLEHLQDIYQDDEVYDAIWFDGGLSEDNERHEADDYYEGYEAGAAMVLAQLHEVFEITPDPEPTT